MQELAPYPQELKDLLTRNSHAAKNFQNNIRKYNSAFSFVSFGANITPPRGVGPPCFRINGQIYHRSGTLHPNENDAPVYNQLYIYDGQTANAHRLNRQENQEYREDVMQLIQNIMDEESPYIRAYRYMADIEREENIRVVTENCQPSEVRMYMRTGRNRRRYNVPTHDEVAAIFVGDNGAPPAQRDIVFYPGNHPLQ